jgi:hypothetical protein
MAILAFALMTTPAFAADILVELTAEQVDVTMADGQLVPMWGLRLTADAVGSATVPGPTIRAVAGDNLTITLTNTLAEVTSLVINGQKATETDAMMPTWTDDTTGARGANLTKRVRSYTHEAGTGSGTATYAWSGLKAGTYLVASGTHPSVQVPMGLYAALVVDTVANAQAYPDVASAYSADAVLLFSEVDPALNAAVVAGDYGTPAYTTSMAVGYEPKYFLINGTSYTGTSVPLAGAPAGENTLLRFLNAGLRSRIPVLQGAYMNLIANDGNLLPYAQKQYSPVLAPGQTLDALFQPSSEGVYAIYDRAMGLTNGGTLPGGALTSVSVSSPIPSRLGIFRTTGDNAGRWYFDINGNGAWDSGIDSVAGPFGLGTDRPVPGDWNGDGIEQISVFRNGVWYFDVNGNGIWDSGIDTSTVFGLSSDIPVVGDWTGSGSSQVGVFRNGTWYLDVNGNGALDAGIDAVASFGQAGDIPVVGDWNGDGTTQVGVFRNGTWYLDANGNGAWDAGIDIVGTFGSGSDIPIVGDWNGDGIAQVGVYRNGAWYLDANANFAWDAGIDIIAPMFGGVTGDVPVIGKWR